MVAAEECGSKTSYTRLSALLILEKTSEYIRHWFKWKEVVYQPVHVKREKLPTQKELKSLQYNQTHLRTGLLGPPALYAK